MSAAELPAQPGLSLLEELEAEPDQAGRLRRMNRWAGPLQPQDVEPLIRKASQAALTDPPSCLEWTELALKAGWRGATAQKGAAQEGASREAAPWLALRARSFIARSEALAALGRPAEAEEQGEHILSLLHRQGAAPHLRGLFLLADARTTLAFHELEPAQAELAPASDALDGAIEAFQQTGHRGMVAYSRWLRALLWIHIAAPAGLLPEPLTEARDEALAGPPTLPEGLLAELVELAAHGDLSGCLRRLDPYRPLFEADCGDEETLP